MKTFYNSFRTNGKGIILMSLSSVCVAFGQYFWKISGGKLSSTLFLGFVLYGLGATVMIVAYRFGSLSVLQPFLALGYILSLFIAFFFLREPLGLFKTIGIIFITLGVICIGGGDAGE